MSDIHQDVERILLAREVEEARLQVRRESAHIESLEGLDVGTDESDYHLVPAGLPGILLGRVTGRKKGRPGQLVTVLWSGRQILCHLSDLEPCGTV
jgi:hypothetical protein